MVLGLEIGKVAGRMFEIDDQPVETRLTQYFRGHGAHCLQETADGLPAVFQLSFNDVPHLLINPFVASRNTSRGFRQWL
jgi:hypothetical protein